MQRLFAAFVCCLAGLAGASVAFAQTPAPAPKGYTTVLPATTIAPPTSRAAALSALVVYPLIPDKSFTTTITADSALGGGNYTITILGRNPLFRGKTTTTIPTQIIPLIITINDGKTTVTYDPTAPDTCVPGNLSDVNVMGQSPVLTNNPWTMNGVLVGDTQYIDAFQRAEFWSNVSGTAYHVILSPTTLGAQSLSFTGAANGLNFFAAAPGCASGAEFLGIVNINTMDAIVRNLITGPLASMVNAGTFPLFLTKEVVESTDMPPDAHACCILGYHSGLTVGTNLQIYGLFSVDGGQVFGPGYTNTFSHEVAEAVNDPTTNNPTPPWGNVGQVPAPNCQNNLEVGDPLSPGFNTPTHPFSTLAANGLTYTSQELAYYSWFYGSTGLGVGAGGIYSDNGAFHHTAVLCPPGTPTGGPY